MKVHNLKGNFRPRSHDEVKVTETGGITQLMYSSNQMGGVIRKINKDFYEVIPTGEIKKYNHTEKRVENLNGIKQSLKRARDIISTNVVDVNQWLWITLTYAKVQTDRKEIYNDYRKFVMRFRNFLKKEINISSFEYIILFEPQERRLYARTSDYFGFLDREKHPYIKNEILRSIWRTSAL